MKFLKIKHPVMHILIMCKNVIWLQWEQEQRKAKCASTIVGNPILVGNKKGNKLHNIRTGANESMTTLGSEFLLKIKCYYYTDNCFSNKNYLAFI